MSKQDSIVKAAADADAFEESGNLADLHAMQDSVQSALDQGASLQDIAAARQTGSSGMGSVGGTS